ncbi:methyltransferase domain-containing protein [Rhodanobacter sp. DHB23]|uniref:methyltransferase domain-containing protein n=1 Tax=Rhodanobacter sp. DHB23 TaxID=2775923 RepID=UPI00177C11BB|nr:methyltransferase domain-containing protein [Rhodanobacter sp. DHB23]MBD8873275.1 methyltransferase domain-containing protein [Rhodanobacter sp. DHB23]
MSSNYDNPFYHDNVYGHVVRLLQDHSAGGQGLHLDIGCGFGRMAEHVRDHVGREYIGFDRDDEALASLNERGFVGIALDLADPVAAEAAITAAVAGRKVASLSIIDTLEHVYNGAEILAMLRRIALNSAAVLVVSVPNVAHRDVGFKLAFGKWDYTDTGLLDITHVRFFSESLVHSLLLSSGWHLIGENNVTLDKSDQHFPALHPVLAEGTPLHDHLARLRDGVDRCARINQFVGAYLPGPSLRGADEVPDVAPFLSVVTRTQGKRIDTLRDVLLCLSAQTSQDFEVCVIGHKLSHEAQLAVERVIDDTHADLRRRVRLIRVDHGTRTTPLNVGFRAARGNYVAILDDDDIVLGHWVEEFKRLAAANPGRVLRSANVAQTWQPVKTGVSSRSVRSIGSFEACYPVKFDFFQHLVENATPPVSLAFPRACFHDLKIEFDETLTTTEDWDFLMRTAEICGVASDGEITSIYRKWDNAESSYTAHSIEEWQTNHYAIWRKLDAKPILLEPGSATRIRHLVHDWNRRYLAAPGPQPDPHLDATQYENALREEIHNLLHSRTWRVGAPMRGLAAMAGRRWTYPMLWAMNGPQLERYLSTLRSSRSWRFGTWVRARVGAGNA